MRISKYQLRRIVKKAILSEVGEIKNPGPYIDGARATKIKDEDGEPIDKDGDGVPNKADADPDDGSIKESGCGGDLMPIDASPLGNEIISNEIPHMDSYDAGMEFLESNSGMLTSTIDSIMSITGATCKKSFLMAIVDYFSSMLDEPSGDLQQITLGLGGIGF